MKRTFVLLLILIFATALMRDGGAYVPHVAGNSYCTATMAVDSNGYSIIPDPMPPAKKYYIASAAHGGLDTNNGLYPARGSGNNGPWASLAKAYQVLAHTNADNHVLLNKGDVFTETPGAYAMTSNGLNCAHPFVIGTYGSGARPIIQCDASVGNGCFKAYYAIKGGDYVAYVGLELYAYKRDPSNPAYNPNTLGQELETFLFQNDFHWSLIEDVKTSYFSRQGIVADSTLSGAKGGVVELRKNVFTNAWFKYGGGNYFAGFHNIIQDGNVYAYGFLNDGAFPIALTVASPTVATWTGNLLGNANGVALTADSKIGIVENSNTIPSPLRAYYTFETATAGTDYYAVNIGTCAGCTNTDQFNISTAPCATTSRCGSLINITSCNSPCSLSQSLVLEQSGGNIRGSAQRTHTNYLQSDAAVPLISVDLATFTENIFAYGGGAGDCECAPGLFDNNLWLQNALAFITGKGRPISTLLNIPTTIKNNVIIEGKPMEGYGIVQYPNNYTDPRGIGYAPVAQTGPVTVTNNIVAHIAQISSYNQFGLALGGPYTNPAIITTDATAVIGMIGDGASANPNPQMYNGSPMYFTTDGALPNGLSGSGAIYYVRNYNPWSGPVAKDSNGFTFPVINTTPVTITIASPACITWPGNTLAIGTPIFFNTTGSLPTGISAANLAGDYIPNYYVISAGFNSCNGAGSFEIAASVGGTAINTSGTQSGTQSAGSLITTTFNVSSTPTGSLIGSLTCSGLCLRSHQQFGQYLYPISITNNVICDWLNPVGAVLRAGSISGNTITPNIVNGVSNYSASAANLAGIPTVPSGCDGTWAGSGGNTAHPVAFPHPNLTVATYDCDVLGNCTPGVNGATACPGISLTGYCGAEQHFLSLAMQQSKDTFDLRLTAGAVNDYIRAGFGMTYQ